MSNDTIAQRKAHAIEKLTNDRDNAIKRAEAAESRAAQAEAEHTNDVENLRHYLALVDTLESRTADLLKANREQAEALATLRQERDYQVRRVESLQATLTTIDNERATIAEQLKQAQRVVNAAQMYLYGPRNDDPNRQHERMAELIESVGVMQP